MVADAPMIVSGMFGCHLTSLYVWNVLELAVWADSSSNVGEHQDAVTDCAFHRNGPASPRSCGLDSLVHPSVRCHSFLLVNWNQFLHSILVTPW